MAEMTYASYTYSWFAVLGCACADVHSYQIPREWVGVEMDMLYKVNYKYYAINIHNLFIIIIYETWWWCALYMMILMMLILFN